ncbi:hypothetical protein VTN77DRAFT_6220 [Rasamsonia byssochlamydoides]|uniref:uncharacterized protein n=1 Tax=Rasamsonia byssochlamydoides TaxID=89139 RepID=UPI0037427987
MLAMTFGRPMMIPPEHYYNAEMPEPVDDARITATHIAPQPKDSASPKILLFIHKVKLCIILHNILRTLYQAGGDDGETKFRGGDMMEFDQQLCTWVASLPASMRMGEPLEENPEDAASARPRNVLYTRYLTVRILLTRPSLAVVARTADPAGGLRPLGQAFALCAAETCIDTSKRLIDHIRAHLGRGRRFLGAAWYNTHSVFSAALVLFAAQIIPALRGRVSDGRHWKDSIEVMRLLSRKCSSARTYLSILELFNKYLTQSDGPAQQQTELEEMHTGWSDCSSTSPSVFSRIGWTHWGSMS